MSAVLVLLVTTELQIWRVLQVARDQSTFASRENESCSNLIFIYCVRPRYQKELN